MGWYPTCKQSCTGNPLKGSSLENQQAVISVKTDHSEKKEAVACGHTEIYRCPNSRTFAPFKDHSNKRGLLM